VRAQLHEHLHVAVALQQAERQHLEQALLEESRRLADMERTEDEMAAAAIAASLADLNLAMWRESAAGAGPASRLGAASAAARAASGSPPQSPVGVAAPTPLPVAHRRAGSTVTSISSTSASRSASPCSTASGELLTTLDVS